ncbi:MAG: hypothetical protein ACKVOR_08325 [Flavobacteriales bacterium]
MKNKITAAIAIILCTAILGACTGYHDCGAYNKVPSAQLKQGK